jgi:hypothetical protein
MNVDESYVNGHRHFVLLVGTFDNDPSITQGAVLGLWTEAALFPSIWITDSRVHWASVDNNSALHFIPFDNKEENFVIRFNPDTGLITTLEAMRFRDAGDQARKILWIPQNEEGKYIKGSKISSVGSATWMDQGKRWSVFTLEEVKYNVDVSTCIQQKGP